MEITDTRTFCASKTRYFLDCHSHQVYHAHELISIYCICEDDSLFAAYRVMNTYVTTDEIVAIPLLRAPVLAPGNGDLDLSLCVTALPALAFASLVWIPANQER